MQDFSDFHSLVSSMMEDFGGNGTLLARAGQGTYDTLTGKTTVGVNEIPVKCILMDMTLRSNGATARDKALIDEADKLLYVEPSSDLLPILMPNGVLDFSRVDDRVRVGGYTFRVLTVKVVEPSVSAFQSQPILFELYLRR